MTKTAREIVKTKVDHIVHFREYRRQQREEMKRSGAVGATPLRAVVPHKGYVFASDYFTIDDGIHDADDCVATVLTLIVDKQTARGLPPMWGVQLFPQLSNTQVTMEVINDFQVLNDKRVKSLKKSATNGFDQKVINASNDTDAEDRLKYSKSLNDRDVLFSDLNDSDSYLLATWKMLLKAPDVSTLDDALDEITHIFRDYNQGCFGWAPFAGRQRDDFHRLLTKPEDQLGKPLGFTSSEFAGAYGLPARGLSDPYGEYIGNTINDLFVSGVLFDTDAFASHVVIGSDALGTLIPPQQVPQGTHASALWGVKIAQNALLNGHRVVSLVLDNTDLSQLGANLDDISVNVAMNAGAINPFEIFDRDNNEMTAMAAHTEMIKLMTEQFSTDLSDYDTGRLLTRTLEEFYADKYMWVPNAAERRDQLRLLNLPHQQYPRLQDFVGYLREALRNAKARNDNQDITGYSRLLGIFENMASVNGDLFNQITSLDVDKAKMAPNVIYNLADLKRRGLSVALAQLVNALGFAASYLGEQRNNPNGAGDTIIIYGADELGMNINDASKAQERQKSIFKYLQSQMKSLRDRKVRIVWLYNDTESMLAQGSLNDLETSDYIITGALNERNIAGYEAELGKKLPDQLATCVGSLNDDEFFIHRKNENILLRAQLVLEPHVDLGRQQRMAR